MNYDLQLRPWPCCENPHHCCPERIRFLFINAVRKMTWNLTNFPASAIRSRICSSSTVSSIPLLLFKTFYELIIGKTSLLANHLQRSLDFDLLEYGTHMRKPLGKRMDRICKMSLKSLRFFLFWNRFYHDGSCSTSSQIIPSRQGPTLLRRLHSTKHLPQHNGADTAPPSRTSS